MAGIRQVINVSNVIPIPAYRVFWDVGAEETENYRNLGRHLSYMQLQGRSLETIGARRWLLLRIRAQLGKPLIEASAGELLAWRQSLAVDRDSVRTYVSHVRGFYTWARRTGLRPDDPSADLPVPKRRRRLPRPIGEEDLLSALEGAPPRIRPWLGLAGWAGLRAKEIALLRREQVIEHGSPPGIFIAADATKGCDERYIPMHPVVAEVLAEHGLPARGWVFPRHDGQPGPNRPDLISHLACRYLHDTGLPETLHQLRHRFGTMFYAGCHDQRLTQEQLGHRHSDSTAGYVAVVAADAAAVIASMPGPARIRGVARGA